MSPITTVRRGAAALVVALLIAAAGGAGGVWASHQFSDVGNGNFFHESIGNIASAGCASGFNDGTFRPNQPATRGQFAYWTNNCGARIDDNYTSWVVDQNGVERSLGSVSVTAGALDNPRIDTGGYVWVNTALTAQMGADTNCRVDVWMVDNRTSQTVAETTLNPNGALTNIPNHASGALNNVAPISGGETATFSIRGIAGGCPNLASPLSLVEADSVAMYVPFDGTGAGGGG